MPPANGATARFVERTRVFCPLRVLDIQLSTRREGLTGASVARRQDAVEHINAASDRFHEIFGSSDAHEITRSLFWHPRRNLVEHAEHDGLLFADTQSADRVTVKTDFDRVFETFPP